MLAVAGCGGEDHANKPRPATPEEVSAKVGEGKVVVSPREFGAGLAVFTVSNQTDDVVQLTLEGPTEAVSEPIEAGGVADGFKVSVAEGDYLVSAGDEVQRPVHRARRRPGAAVVVERAADSLAGT